MLALPVHSGYNVQCCHVHAWLQILSGHDKKIAEMHQQTATYQLYVHTALTAAVMSHTVSHVVQELDSQDPVHKQFWDAMMVIAEVELQEALKQDELDWARLRGEPIPAKYTIKEAGLHESIDSDVQMMLAGRCCCDVLTQAWTLRIQHFCTAGSACICSAIFLRWLETPIFCSFFVCSLVRLVMCLFVHSSIHPCNAGTMLVPQILLSSSTQGN